MTAASGPKPSLRTLVIGGNTGRWTYASPDRNHLVSNGVEALVFLLKGDYIGKEVPSPQTLARYDLVVANLNPQQIPGLAKIAAGRPSHQQWVSLIEGCGKDYLDPTPALRRLLDASDLIAVLNQHTAGYFRHLSGTRTEWLGLPYPAAEVRAMATPPDRRRNEVLICPRRHYEPSVLVGNALGLPIAAYFGKVSRKPRNLRLFWRRRYFGSDLMLRTWQREPSPVPRRALPERDLRQLWAEAGGFRLWIDLDPRYTWARWVIDAAALGVPIVATESTAHAQLLFPETTVRNEFCVGEAIAIGRRLLDDPDWAEHTVAAAREHLRVFTPEACLKRLSDALAIDLAGRLAEPR